MKLKHRLISNTIFSILNLGVTRIIGFILTPYILFKLGPERFGIWAIVAGILGFVGKADLGVATSYVKYISQFYARKEYENLNKVINSGFVYYVGISIVIYCIASFGGEAFFSWYLQKEGPEILYEVKRLFYFLLMIRLFSWTLGVFTGILSGVQRFDIVHKIRMWVFAFKALCVFIFLGQRMV